MTQTDMLYLASIALILTLLTFIAIKLKLTGEASKVAFAVYKYSEQLVDLQQERLKSADKQALAEILTVVLTGKYPLLTVLITPTLVQSIIDKLITEANQLIDDSQEVISDFLEKDN